MKPHPFYQDGDLKAGDRVKIYQKPISLEDFEGIAELEKFISERFDGFQRWIVKFDNGESVERNIYPAWPKQP